ncbi:hypothetical protein [Bdellovibrio svalbardensis]|uniref:DUF4407 domain-containing protein n=1 Tax=Bdellovibrio svalbardensis TaxID=2972972 RepID=A0ABT6DLX5_9BACT|nr:hypothetical protein [Bdellovibrio svalbardensis]MDG0817502.1 hypothetical protein [Bdellovibrio svalbardensis]
MVQLWIVIGLALSATAVSFLGATFSIVGIGKLFSGAIVAVWLMAGSLELAKFVVAAYLHQTWRNIGFMFRAYLVSCVIVLSLITSMGIFGFLSDAYSTSSAILESENIKLQKLQSEQTMANSEVVRITRSVDEIPDQRISKKLKARAEVEPMIRELKVKISTIESQIAEARLKIIEVKQKVGPLIYISKAFNMDIDTVVKYLILVFVSVFDPLAICLVIAFSDALLKRSQALNNPEAVSTETSPNVEPVNPNEVIASLKMAFADDTNSTDPSKKEGAG